MDLMKVGADWGGGGTFKPFTSTISGAQRVTDSHGRFLDAVIAGRVYFMSLAAGAGTAYVGAAGGTPLLAIHNPANSNKYASLLAVSLSLRAIATVAGQTGLNVWGGPSVLPTGTTTAPRSALSFAASGSAMVGFSNAALTGSTALTLALALATHYWATAAGAFEAPGFFETGGLPVAVPGNELAVGLTVIPTTLSVDVSMFWEELPYLIQV